LVPCTVKLLHRKKGKEKSMGIRRVAGLAGNRLLMRVDNSTGKGTSGMDKFNSKVHRVHMELGGKLLNSLRIETQFFEMLQIVGVVDGAAHTQKDDLESNGGSLEAPWRVYRRYGYKCIEDMDTNVQKSHAPFNPEHIAFDPCLSC
jgi:hypothetical protein